ncbi:PilW family protein [Tuwongella immobilis]|uniref:Prepilin-type N-terminal cleavage/methylation domain-containing protein n=1 Tax=Tuwongella immobilis TaxID=692036 RepID=A0A6C2YJU4_9BACT|nr:prepilin-type N-terminal cleavage/methylation domain-containing protein [Tuwongella immobilis]VIP01561.1 unnamed protein product [Tuwongella immobilis]VTR98774.1 unnamed protein product [Tuwongella immobilis]
MYLKQTFSSKRSGFTLVELMVAAAISISIMVILSEAFTAGIDTFRKLKTIGDQQELLRSASIILRRDLAAEHFGEATESWNGPFLSDQRLDLSDNPTPPMLPSTIYSEPNGWRPPPRGFFRFVQSTPKVPFNLGNIVSAGYSDEPVDFDLLPSSIARDHLLHFTVKLPGNRVHQLFQTSRIPPAYIAVSPPGFQGDGIFYSPWAEVAYWMEPSGERSSGEDGSPGLPLYTLHRRQRLLVDTPLNKGTGFPPGHPLNVTSDPNLTFPDVSWHQRLDGSTVSWEPNTPETITNPARRGLIGEGFPGTLSVVPRPATLQFPVALEPSPTGTPIRSGDDILLTNVISFQIRACYDTVPTTPPTPAIGSPEFRDLPSPGLNALYNAWGARVFDTWTRTEEPFRSRWFSYGKTTPEITIATLPLRIRIKAFEIQIRIWDTKHQATRQMTILQDV